MPQIELSKTVFLRWKKVKECNSSKHLKSHSAFANFLLNCYEKSVIEENNCNRDKKGYVIPENNTDIITKGK